MGSEDDFLDLIAGELSKATAAGNEQTGQKKASILYFGKDEESRDLVKNNLAASYDLFYTEDVKQVPKLLKSVQAIILDPSCSTYKIGISLTKKLKDDFKEIKVFHILRNISHEYGVFMNNHPFQLPDYAAEFDQINNLFKYINSNL
jgi:uracil phosphoribosyltransferase